MNYHAQIGDLVAVRGFALTQEVVDVLPNGRLAVRLPKPWRLNGDDARFVITTADVARLIARDAHATDCAA